MTAPIMAKDPVADIVAFILELDKLKTVTRKTRPLSLERYENSAEHSWQIAMLAMAMSAHAPPSCDIAHVVALLLVHDIGEIDTGDTMIFVEGGWTERKAAEREAVVRIFGLLPTAQYRQLLDLWDEFDGGHTVEARFAHALDRAMPVLLNLANQGQSWRENGIRYEQVVARVAGPVAAGCPALWAYLDGRLRAARQDGLFATG